MYVQISAGLGNNSHGLQTLFWAAIKYDGRRSVLESMLNSHPMALKYLMPALIHFYIGMSILLGHLRGCGELNFTRGGADGCKFTILR